MSPKCFMAGPFATMIFNNLILLNKAHNCRGVIAPRLAKPDYLAAYLRVDVLLSELGGDPANAVDVVRQALVACQQTELLKLTEDGVVLVGWDETWDRDTSTERVRAHRARAKHAKLLNGTDETGETLHVTDETPGTNGTNETNVTVDQSRIDQSRVESERSPSVTKVTAPPKPKPKSKAEKLFERHGEDAGFLWDLQEIRRASVMPNSRPLKPTKERLLRICHLLETYSVDDATAVLDAYAAETRRKPASGKHFNGDTNWREANFVRTLGGVGAPETNHGHAPPDDWENQPEGQIDLSTGQVVEENDEQSKTLE